jgi:ethanolaminephosphotransferase
LTVVVVVAAAPAAFLDSFSRCFVDSFFLSSFSIHFPYRFHCNMSASTEQLHDTTKTDTTTSDDVAHEHPDDRTKTHVWCFEPHAQGGVLTQDGVNQIAHHKYHGGAYTWLDQRLNPWWTALTERVPLYVAPNTLTTLGLAHCLVAYAVTWRASPNLDQHVPNYVLLLNAVCVAIYYTLDCMDGKQARRTNSSSPLGQLFDHGIDCLCLLQHLSAAQAWCMAGGTGWFFVVQAVLQFSFFCAQWEEYYTGVLPHSTGNFGVTEVNYGMAVLSLVNALVNRKALYTPETIRYAGMGWAGVMSLLIVLSARRVMQANPSTKTFLSAVSKLLSPLCLSLSPLFLPPSVWETETRFVHLAVGLAMTLITIKIIVFSMAKQAYATVQWDVVPCLLAVAWIRLDKRWTSAGIRLIWQVLTVFYLLRLHVWTVTAIEQIKKRLGVQLFRIPHPGKKQN